MKIVVIGGTGLIGSQLVARLAERGHDAVAAAPSTGVDTLTGEGVREALTGADVVVDVSNSPNWEDAAVLEFFETSTRTLLAAEAELGVGHHVALSVVGTQALSGSGYFRAKIAQEKLIRESPVPYSIVHATQFFEFIQSLAASSTVDGVVRVAPVLLQPIASADVAASVADVALGEPVGGIVEIAGPETFPLAEVIRMRLGDDAEIAVDPEVRLHRRRRRGADAGARRGRPAGSGAVRVVAEQQRERARVVRGRRFTRRVALASGLGHCLESSLW